MCKWTIRKSILPSGEKSGACAYLVERVRDNTGRSIASNFRFAKVAKLRSHQTTKIEAKRILRSIRRLDSGSYDMIPVPPTSNSSIDWRI